MPLTLIVTGMHRSGTSLTASFLQAAGISLGDNLLGSDRFNVKGYFEDVDFLELQRGILQQCCRYGKQGWADWGWTETEDFDRDILSNYIPQALELIKNRNDKNLPWGWKDPRTSLLLDFWRELLPEAKYLLVYRFPWDVSDSVLRINHPNFVQNPDYAMKAWVFYNSHVLEFYRRYADRCLLFNINSFLENPDRLVELLQNKLGIKLTAWENKTEFQKIYDKNLFTQLEWNHPAVLLLAKLAPQYLSLLADLDKYADMPSSFAFPSEENTEFNSEKLVMQLYYQVVATRLQLQELAQKQGEKENLQLRIDSLESEIAAMKTSKIWKLHQKISKFKSMI